MTAKPNESIPRSTLLLTRSEVEEFLDVRSCIEAVEAAFRAEAEGGVLPAGVLGTHAEHGGFHVKAAGLKHPRAFYAAKINANFPDNSVRHGLPTIQGVLALFDAENGKVLAIMDSTSVTALRTGAATGVAAKYLARSDARTATIVGCGVQGVAQLRALLAVRPSIAEVHAFDTDAVRAKSYAEKMATETGLEVNAVSDYRTAVRSSEVVITCTTSRSPILDASDIQPGTFIGAVGADNEEKHEIHPDLMRAGVVVTDSTAQCAKIGDLHHAISAGVMNATDVFAQLADIVSGRRTVMDPARSAIIFDSTGTALQDVAAALMTYERACVAGRGREVMLQS